MPVESGDGTVHLWTPHSYLVHQIYYYFFNVDLPQCEVIFLITIYDLYFSYQQCYKC